MNDTSSGADTSMCAPGARQAVLANRFERLIDSVQDYAIFLLDPQGRVTTWNQGAQRLKGYSATEIIGRHFSAFYPREAVDRGWPDEELQQARERGRFEDEGWRVRKDGSRFWANVVITALYEPSGELAGFGKITRDLSERHQQEEQLRLGEERFRLLVDSVGEYAIYLLDPQGHVQSWNRGAQTIKGYSAQEIIGRHFSVFYPPEARAADKPRSELEQAQRLGAIEIEGWRVRKDGTRFWANVVINAVRGPEGQLRGFAKVTRDMTERRRLEELESTSRRMNEFLAMLGHELRNPLAPLRNAVSIMQLEAMPTALLRHSRDVIDRQLTHMARLVDDLLDVGRLSAGKIKLDKELVNLEEVVARAVETARPFIDARRHRLTVQPAAEPVFVWGDLTRLSQVLQNLLLNAAKYTPEGGQVRVRTRRDNGFVTLSVQDNGCGITPEQLARIFELFGQAQGGSPSDTGLGIGLTLARRLAELHGGTVDGESPGPGQGSTFHLRLPVADAAPAPEKDETDLHGGEALRILVVDDNRDSADSMAAVIRLLGHEVECAYDGAAAVRAATRFKPQVALLDLAMPGMDGFATRERLARLPGLQNLYTVALTGYGGEDDKRRTRQAGFDRHLTKPVDLAGISQILAELSPAPHGPP